MNAEFIISFYKRYGHLPSKACCCETHVHQQEFAASRDVSNTLLVAYRMPPEKQMEYLKKRGANLLTSDMWSKLQNQSHDKAFTVANVMKADILQSIYDEIQSALSGGMSLSKFQENLLPRLEQMGWSGAKPHRLRTIYETNLETTYAKASYENSLLLKNTHPFRQWLPSRSAVRDPVHMRFYGLVLPVDDPFWKKHYPRGRYGCKCDERILTEQQVKEKGLKVSDGDKFMNKLMQNDEFVQQLEQNNKGNLDLLKQWTPELNKYVSGIKEQLAQILQEKTQVNTTQITEKSTPIDNVIAKKKPIKVKVGSVDEYSEIVEKVYQKEIDESLGEWKDALLGDRSDYLELLNDKARSSVRKYMTDDGYVAMNRALREGKSNDDVLQMQEEGVGYELKKDMTLFRGIRLDGKLKEFSPKIGESLKMKGFTSTSCSFYTAKSFTEAEDYADNMILVIKAKAGQKVGFGTSHEQEIIFNHNTKFKVTSITKYQIANENITSTIVEVEVE